MTSDRCHPGMGGYARVASIKRLENRYRAPSIDGITEGDGNGIWTPFIRFYPWIEAPIVT